MYRHLGHFQYFASTNNAAIDNLTQLYFLIGRGVTLG